MISPSSRPPVIRSTSQQRAVKEKKTSFFFKFAICHFCDYLQAPHVIEESTDTMTPEEREQYQREIADRLRRQQAGGQDVIRATGVGEGLGYAYGTAERRDPQATVTALEEEARRREKERREEEERERERQEWKRREEERLEREKEAERERRLQEWIESEKKRW